MGKKKSAGISECINKWENSEIESFRIQYCLNEYSNKFSILSNGFFQENVNSTGDYT